jgi:threonyl-tRNA synthetase
VIGDREIAENKVSLRSRDEEGLSSLGIDELLEKLREEIRHKIMK